MLQQVVDQFRLPWLAERKPVDRQRAEDGRQFGTITTEGIERDDSLDAVLLKPFGFDVPKRDKLALRRSLTFHESGDAE